MPAPARRLPVDGGRPGPRPAPAPAHGTGCIRTPGGANFLKRLRARDPAAKLVGMTRLPSSHDLPLLLTDDDIHSRVDTLIAPAVRDGQLWLFFLDGDQRQSPVLVPIGDLPPLPDGVVDNLGAVLAQVLPDLATDMGPGSVVMIRERRGPAAVLPADRAWADALTRTCRARDVVLRGVYLVTPTATRPLRAR